MQFLSLPDLLDLARAKGTDKQYREWIQKQPSCISGAFSEWIEQLGEARNPACHVRRAATFGTAFKADYSCVPMTHKEHADQSNKGEAYCLGVHSACYPWTNERAKEFFDEQRVKYLAMWIFS